MSRRCDEDGCCPREFKVIHWVMPDGTPRVSDHEWDWTSPELVNETVILGHNSDRYRIKAHYVVIELEHEALFGSGLAELDVPASPTLGSPT